MTSLQAILNPAPLPTPAPGSGSILSQSSSPTSTTSSDPDVARIHSLSANRSLAPLASDSNMTETPIPTLPYVFSRSTIRDSPVGLVATSVGSSKGTLLSRTRPRGHIQYPPCEHVDAMSLGEIHKFSVFPFGRIAECCAHIPYNSGKKDFFEKTRREGFEVFKYVFRMPGRDAEYTVMWDYNIGLVRLTPFFKCCDYGKTQPAKMLNQNPGLKDISHSITGGSISAQGYWMPWECAKAVCATFCYKIAGALIPLFGPDFPSQCIHPDASDFGHMAISRLIVQEATREAERHRSEQYEAEMKANSTFLSPLRNPESPWSQQHSRTARDTPEGRVHLRRDYVLDLAVYRDNDSPYMADGGGGRPVSAGSSSSGRVYHHSPGRMLSPLPVPRTSAWTPVNEQNRGRGSLGDPYLSAVPRRVPLRSMTTTLPGHWAELPPSSQHDQTSNQRPNGDASVGTHHHSLSYPSYPVLPRPKLPALPHLDSPNWPRGSPSSTKRRFCHEGDMLHHARLPAPTPTSDKRATYPADTDQDRAAALQLLKLGLLDRVREEQMRERKEKERRVASRSPRQQQRQRRKKERKNNCVKSVGVGSGQGREEVVGIGLRQEEDNEGFKLSTDIEICAERAMAVMESHQRKRHRAGSEAELVQSGVVAQE